MRHCVPREVVVFHFHQAYDNMALSDKCLFGYIPTLQDIESEHRLKKSYALFEVFNI